MGINYPPQPPTTANGEQITAIQATTTAVNHPAFSERSGGFIINTANKDLWVKFGNADDAPALTAALPFTRVPTNANIDIPDDFVGPIALIWSASVNSSGQAIIHEMKP